MRQVKTDTFWYIVKQGWKRFKEDMRRLIPIAVLSVLLVSCSLDDNCGIVTGHAVEGYTHYLQLDNDYYYQVHTFIFNNTNQGEYICL